VAEALQLWSNKKNYSEAIYIYANATKQLTISTKRWKFQWLSGTLCAKYMLIRGSEGMTPGKFWNLGSLRVHLLAIHISAQI